jgi:flagellar biosynthesis/type III secretory pathway protein FliH
MLLTEWNTEEAKEVWFAEGREEGLSKGREEVVRNALQEGFSFDIIEKLTGLNRESIRHIQAGM